MLVQMCEFILQRLNKDFLYEIARVVCLDILCYEKVGVCVRIVVYETVLKCLRPTSQKFKIKKIFTKESTIHNVEAMFKLI